MDFVKAGDTALFDLLALQADRTALTGSANLRVDIRKDHPTLVIFYDFADGNFKTGGWTTRLGALAEVSSSLAPGHYRLTVDTTGWAAGDYIITASEVTTALAANLPVSDTLRVGASMADISARLPAALDGGYMASKVEAVAAGAVTNAALADGAISAPKIADDAITSAKIAAGAITSSEAPALANLDAAVSSRAAPGAAMDLVDNAVDAGALAAAGVSVIQSGLATASAQTTAQTSLTDIQGRLPATLSGGRMRSAVEAMANDVVTAAVIATDAIDADAIAASAASEIQSGLATASALAAVGSDAAAAASRAADIQGRLPAALVGGRIDASVGVVASGAITAAAIATDAIGAAQVAASAVSELQNGLATASSLTSVSAGVAAIATSVGDISGRLPATLVNGRIDASVGAAASNVITASCIAADAIGATQLAASAASEIRSGLALASDLATLDSKVVDVQGRLPAVLVGGRIDASVGAMAANTLTAAALAADAAAEVGASVWATAVSSPASGSFGRYVQRIFQLGYNRLELASTGGGRNTLYADDGATPLVTFAVRDVVGASLSLTSGSPARRGAGVEQ